MKILSVVGARPNFVKIAPILRAVACANHRGRAGAEPLESVLVHTEQHYDDAMSAAFFTDLQIRRPDRTLGVGSGSHAMQTAEIMRRFEPVVVEEHPDVVLVVGDVNSTAACALTAAKLGVRVAHVEAGLRSFDRSMPEEINRIVTDALADFLFTTEESANANLQREGYPAEKVFFVGNVMIDSLLSCRRLAERSTILERLGLTVQCNGSDYALVTLHRPSNVDASEKLEAILGALAQLAWEIPVVLPVHPRTRARIDEFGLTRYVDLIPLDGGPVIIHPGRISVLEPVGYLDFLRLMSSARLVLTDSGGIQDETTCLSVACLTLRDNTERPVTLAAGTSTLVGSDPDRILACAHTALENGQRPTTLPPLWDGHAAERIVRVLVERLA
ncbi:MAG: non-hydrolyzing UDP-N-acetylglucosamine 2-epimerase [Candidatus Binatia bacterium]